MWKWPQDRLPVCSAAPPEHTRRLLAVPQPPCALLAVPQSPLCSFPCTLWPSRCFLVCPISPRCAPEPCLQHCVVSGYSRGSWGFMVSGWAAPSSSDGSPVLWASRWLEVSLEPSILPSAASSLPAWPRKDAPPEQEQVAAPALTAVLQVEGLVSKETMMLPKTHPFCSWSGPRQPAFVCRTLGRQEGSPISPPQLFISLPSSQQMKPGYLYCFGFPLLPSKEGLLGKAVAPQSSFSQQSCGLLCLIPAVPPMAQCLGWGQRRSAPCFSMESTLDSGPS